MSFDRILSTKEVLKELKLLNEKPINLALDEFKMPSVTTSFEKRLLEINVPFSIGRQVRQYENINMENETQLLRIPASLWLHLSNFLDTYSLTSLIVACKTWGVIANNQSIRNKLYHEKENKKLLPSAKKFLDTQSKQALPLQDFSTNLATVFR